MRLLTYLRSYGRLALVVVVLLLAVVLLVVSPPARQAMFNLTGEEDLAHQVKGTLELAVLRLTRPPLHLESYAPMPHTGYNPFGINTFLEQEADEANVRRSLQLLHEAGIGWIRQEFPWEDIEIHGKGDFEDRRVNPPRSAWEKYDRIVALAAEYGIEILARLDNPPAWSRARGNEAGTLAPPDHLDDYGDFVEAVVSRYKGRLRFVQIWNEPNIYPEWGEQPPDPEGYVELLKVGYTRAKGANPEIVVVSAALAPTLENSDRAMDDLAFLERMYAAGARDYFDVLAVIGYGLGTGPTDQRAVWHRTNFARPELLRDLMVRHGDAQKPVWVVEMGWNAVPLDMPAPYGRVTLDQQARYTVLAYRRIAESWPWAGVGFLWFFRRPNYSEVNQPFFYFRVVDPDWTPMPVYQALRDLATAPPAVPPGYYQEDHWALKYQGDWRVELDPEAVLGGYRRSNGAGRELSFDFLGGSLELVLRPGAAPFHVSLDGGEAHTVEPPAASRSQSVVVPVAQGLPGGRHHVTLTTGGELGLDGVIVRPGSRPVAPWAVAALLFLGVLVGGVWWARGSRRYPDRP